MNADLSQSRDSLGSRRWAVGRLLSRVFRHGLGTIKPNGGAMPNPDIRPLPSAYGTKPAARRVAHHSHPFNAAQWSCSIELQGDNDKALQALSARCVAETRRLENKFSPYGLTSIVRYINQNAGERPVAVDAETEQLFDLAHAQWVASEGLVDPTAGIARYAWGPQLDHVHSDSELQHLVESIGWQRVAREPGWVRFDHPSLELDFGVLLEAYVADRIADLASAEGALFGKIEICNAMRVFGTPSGATTAAAQSASTAPPHLLQGWPIQAGGVVALRARKGHPSPGTSHSLPSNAPGHLVFNPKTGQPMTHWKTLAIQAPTAVASSGLVLQGANKEGGAISWLNLQAATFLAVRCDDKAFCSNLDLIAWFSTFL
jgi:thiamine biosynthesis lipoprotein